MPLPISLREERPEDRDAVRDINRSAFGREDEARLVDALRAEGPVIVSLVATDGDGRLVGHVLLSSLPITTGSGTLPGAALAPVAVRPDAQRQGVGSALVRRGIGACRERCLAAVIVLGHPAYYARFGFSPAAVRGVRDPFAAGDAFMALELAPGALATPSTVRYAPAFGIPD